MTNGAGLGAAPGCPRSNEPTLDQLLAEPIVQQLMRRDRINEATIRRLLQETAAARPPGANEPTGHQRFAAIRVKSEPTRRGRLSDQDLPLR
jgi:hypothetical protein